ncbi:DUF2971 domain-containing protein [Niveispirillum sp.]|uniref:DUF2971 domain-containing protein n=1 Tax=Niveispirillum sp. TaxID=1917217 RepID=UPI001B48FFBE|nr:DUF2971 domain-containing protein [Niveispirillum sp.]MBP7338751.1 DUF2971 domain-containing protein [Niveispirillum sp.]
MELFHYTGKDAELSIVGGNSFWFSGYDTMNDTTEIRHIDDFLLHNLSDSLDIVFKRFTKERRKEIKKNCTKRGISKASTYQANKLIETLRGILFDGKERLPRAVDPFIMSFCSHDNSSYEYYNGMLSQWRAYGRSGYCLVFDRDALHDILSGERDSYLYNHFGIHDVNYGVDREKFQNDHNLLAELALDAALIESTHPDPESVFHKLIQEYLKCAVKFKHVGFREECEVRAVLSPASIELKSILEKHGPEISLKIKEIKNRPDGRRYIECKFRKKIPLKRIIVSPGEKQSELFHEIKSVVDDGVEVTKSSTPYIEHASATRALS